MRTDRYTLPAIDKKSEKNIKQSGKHIKIDKNKQTNKHKVWYVNGKKTDKHIDWQIDQ